MPNNLDPTELTAIYMTESTAGLSAAGLASTPGLRIVAISRNLDDFAAAAQQTQPDVAIIDTDQYADTAFEAIPIAFDQVPTIGVLVRTPVPTPHSDVAQAMKAGALGFVTASTSGEEVAQAARAVAEGQSWLPADQARELFSSVGEAGELTTAGREAKLKSLVLGLIPLVGAVSAIMSLLWRRYVGQIGVRPVDLAIDPTTRIVDAFFALSVLVGVFGSLLFVRTWFDLLDPRRVPWLGSWVDRHSRISRLFFGWAVLTFVGLLAAYAQIVVALFVGPIVAGLLAARLFDLDDNLPAFLRPRDFRSKRFATIALLITLSCLTALSAEVLLIGPDFDNHGAKGLIAPTVLGFGAQPMTHITVDGTREPRNVLYLGGNADLYVLVDLCKDNEVEFVSVGSSQLIVIDEVTCP